MKMKRKLESAVTMMTIVGGLVLSYSVGVYDGRKTYEPTKLELLNDGSQNIKVLSEKYEYIFSEDRDGTYAKSIKIIKKTGKKSKY